MRWWHSLSTSILAVLAVTAQSQPERGHAFSHRAHAKFELRCTACHHDAEAGERAGFPEARDCQTCHAGASAPKLDSNRLRWERARRLPDYVWFRHSSHRRGLVCADCHGDVARDDVVGPPASLTMRQCMNCHRKRSATLECYACHTVR